MLNKFYVMTLFAAVALAIVCYGQSVKPHSALASISEDYSTSRDNGGDFDASGGTVLPPSKDTSPDQ
jgi:hypothetical protein